MNERLEAIKKFLSSDTNAEFDCYGGNFCTDYGVDYYVGKLESPCSETNLCKLCLSSKNPIILFSAADILGINNYKFYIEERNNEVIYCLDNNELTKFDLEVMKHICSIKSEVISRSFDLLNSEDYKSLFSEPKGWEEYIKQDYIRSLFI